MLADQSKAPPKKNATGELPGELGVACHEARELYREGKVKSVRRLFHFLQREYKYPFGKDAFEAWVKS